MGQDVEKTVRVMQTLLSLADAGEDAQVEVPIVWLDEGDLVCRMNQGAWCSRIEKKLRQQDALVERPRRLR